MGAGAGGLSKCLQYYKGQMITYYIGVVLKMFTLCQILGYYIRNIISIGIWGSGIGMKISFLYNPFENTYIHILRSNTHPKS